MLRRHYATFIKQWPSQKLPRIICSGINLTMDEYTHNSYISLEYMTHIIVGDLQRIREYPKLGFQIEQVCDLTTGQRDADDAVSPPRSSGAALVTECSVR